MSNISYSATQTKQKIDYIRIHVAQQAAHVTPIHEYRVLRVTACVAVYAFDFSCLPSILYMVITEFGERGKWQYGFRRMQRMRSFIVILCSHENGNMHAASTASHRYLTYSVCFSL